MMIAAALKSSSSEMTKTVLSMEARRKHQFPGQKGYILLTDLAHNLLADFATSFGRNEIRRLRPKRIVRDLLAILESCFQ